MFERFKEAILKEYPRLSPESKFRFSCHKGLSCFTQCCGDVNIFLTPYDVLRLKRALNLPSGEFLEEYTLPPILAGEKLPVVLLRMEDDERKSCPFVTSDGCSVYEDRPWSCRMYPLGIASGKTAQRADGEEFCFIVDDESSCSGLNEGNEWTVAEWWKDQGIDLYDQKNESYKEITLHERFREGKGLEPAKSHMFYLACYDIDRFRGLLLESSFLSRFDVDDEIIEKIRTDDEALLDFAYDWLRFSLFGEKTIRIRGGVAAEKKRELGIDSNN
jgi:Fe-S-cluster containining protein